MEALVVAGSIVGLVSLAIQLVDKLQALAADQPADQTQEFTSDLASSAALLGNVRVLASKAKTLNSSSQSGVLLHSLAVQLEDYTDELKEWLGMGQHPLRSSATKRHHPFMRFLRHKFRAQKSIRERILYYEDRISITLSIIGRELDIDNGIKLGGLDTKLNDVVQTVTDEACKMACKLEELSSSSNSLLSHSRSTNRRLEDVSSEISSLMAEFRDLKTVFLDFICSGSSSSSCNDKDQLRGQGPRGGYQAAHIKSKELKSAKVWNTDVEANADDENGSDKESHPQSQGSGSQREPEFEPLLQATTNITKVVRKLYPPLVSEYVSTIVAWQLLAQFYQAVGRRIMSTSNSGM